MQHRHDRRLVERAIALDPRRREDDVVGLPFARLAAGVHHRRPLVVDRGGLAFGVRLVFKRIENLNLIVGAHQADAVVAALLALFFLAVLMFGVRGLGEFDVKLAIAEGLLGLQGFLDTEEGLAISYAQEVAQQSSASKPNKTWIGTLATGLASGVICEPFTFTRLLMFLESVNVLRSLLAGRGLTVAEIREDARKNAQSRCLRTWRGVTHLVRPGICSTKDAVYLRGFLAASQALMEEDAMFERLMVGSVGLNHLDDLTEVGIVKPAVVHRRLATDPELESYIMRFADEARGNG